MTDCIIVGSAACVWDDFSRCPKGVPIIVVNRMIGDFPLEPLAGATLHWDRVEEFKSGRNCFVYSRAEGPGVSSVLLPPLAWHGTSGLYAIWVALHLGFSDILLAGIPLDESPHYYTEDASTIGKFLPHYKEGWLNAENSLAGKVRSMSGWTRELLGGPEG